MTSHKPLSPELARIVTDKGMRAVIETLVDDGWEFLRLSGKNHPIMVWPKAHEIAAATNQVTSTTGTHRQDRIILPLTPGDHRAVLNSLTDARRISGVNHRENLRTGRGKGAKARKTNRDKT